MSDFFFTGGELGYMGWNLDQIRYIQRDKEAGTVKIYFAKDDFFEIGGETAQQFLDVLTRVAAGTPASRALEAARRAVATTNKN